MTLCEPRPKLCVYYSLHVLCYSVFRQCQTYKIIELWLHRKIHGTEAKVADRNVLQVT